MLPMRGEEEVYLPPPPEGLLPVTLSVWEALFQSGVARALDLDSDVSALRRWILYLDQWERATATVLKDGPMGVGSQGQPVVSPAVKYQQQLEINIGALEKQLGLTPMARARLGLTMAEGGLTAAQLNAMIARPPAALEAGNGEEEEGEIIELAGWSTGDD